MEETQSTGVSATNSSNPDRITEQSHPWLLEGFQIYQNKYCNNRLLLTKEISEENSAQKLHRSLTQIKSQTSGTTPPTNSAKNWAKNKDYGSTTPVAASTTQKSTPAQK